MKSNVKNLSRVNDNPDLWLMVNSTPTAVVAPKLDSQLRTAFKNAKAVLQIREMIDGVQYSALDIWRLAYDTCKKSTLLSEEAKRQAQTIQRL